MLEEAKEYSRTAFNQRFTYIGTGKPGGKASGLAFIKDEIDANFTNNMFGDIIVDIPQSTVILTDVFDEFLKANNLYGVAFSERSDEHIAHEFLKAELPTQIVGDLMSLITKTHEPLAIRSSSLLEDALDEPFAGVYETKMIPNNQFDKETRFKKLTEAIKFVYASTFFKGAKDYCAAIRKDIESEKMAVLIQEVVGYRFGDRFYPTVSGVARSYNFYCVGNAKPEDGVINLALGLGKTIVDGGKVWNYSPKFPKSPPPYNSIDELLKLSQTDFWAVNMGKPPAYDPIKETEYLVQCSLQDAEKDETLSSVCSTYDSSSDRLTMGARTTGPKVVNFSPILVGKNIPLNDLLQKLLSDSEKHFGAKVEIEFAVALDSLLNNKPTKFGFLQVRPLAVSTQFIDISEKILQSDDVVIVSDNVMGNGMINEIQEIVFVHPKKFKANTTRAIAKEVETMNNKFLDERKPYILIGFGRWGSSDDWLGIPVNWSQISAAKVIVESTLPEMNPDLSQGSHFFHNITNLGVLYFSIGNSFAQRINWEWLLRQQVVEETQFLRHIHLNTNLRIMADGRSRTGVILQ
ncbi:MAG: PEP/pyruvate-binding domain-containing protein [Bacteroidota bacterium]